MSNQNKALVSFCVYSRSPNKCQRACFIRLRRLAIFFLRNMREEKAGIVHTVKGRGASNDFDPENTWLNTSCLACFSGTDLSLNFLVSHRRMRTGVCLHHTQHPLRTETLVPSFWSCGSSTVIGISQAGIPTSEGTWMAQLAKVRPLALLERRPSSQEHLLFQRMPVQVPVPMFVAHN